MIPDQTLQVAFKQTPDSPKKQPKTYKVDVSKQVEDLTKANELKDAALNEGTIEGADNFTDNYYLISVLPEIINMTNDTEYFGWTSIRQNENGPAPAYLKSYFEDWDKYADMRTELVSLMVPYFKLSLVTREKDNMKWSDISSETQVVLQGTFAGSLDPSAALSEQYNEPVLGLKSFNWRRTAGTGDAGKKAQTVGTIRLFGNNLNIFTKHPYDKLLARSTLGYGLKVVVGWSVAPRALDSLGEGGIDAAEFKNALAQGRKTIYLQTYKNTFDFNQDGTFTVTLDVVGSTEEFMRDFDLLGNIEGLKNKVSIVNKLDAELRGKQSDKVKGDTKKLNDNIDETIGKDDRISSDGVRSIEGNLTALREAADRALKDSDLSESEKSEFKSSIESTIQNQLNVDYNGDSPKFAGKNELADMVDDLIAKPLIDAFKQRTQENMSRIPKILYDDGAIKYIKVGKDEFKSFAGQTLTAIKGKKKQLEAILKSIKAEEEFIDRLYGNTESIDESSAGTLAGDFAGQGQEIPGLDLEESGFLKKLWSDGDDSKSIVFKDKQGKQISAYQYLESKQLLLNVDVYTDQEDVSNFLSNLDREYENLNALDANSAEATELRYGLNYAKKLFLQSSISNEKDFSFGRSQVLWDALKNNKRSELQKIAERKRQIAEQLASMDNALSDGAPPPKPSISSMFQAESLVGPDPTDPTTKENHYISFFFLGDLINALYRLAALDGKHNAIPYIMLGSMAYNSNTREMGIQVQKKQKVALGQRTMIQMAQIPISMRRFQAFFHKFYVQEMTTKVLLGEFLKNVFEVLIRPIFSGEAFNLKLARPRADFLDLDAGEMTIYNYNIMSMIQRINLSQIDPAILLKPEHNVECRSYLMITANLVHKANGRGNYHKDKLLNIPHYYMGADRGVIKTVEFAAVQNKYDATDRAIKASSPTNNSLQVLKTPYNVNLTSIGNPLFALGSSFYLLPTIPGKNNSAAAVSLGLGGYYRVINLESSITDGGTYETSVFAVNEITAQDNAKSNESDDVNCVNDMGIATNPVRAGQDCPDGYTAVGTGKINKEPSSTPKDDTTKGESN